MGFVVFLSLFVIFLTSLYLYIKYKFEYWKKRGVPTLPPEFPYGNFKGMSRTKHTSELVDEIYKAFRGKAPIVGAYFSITPALVVMDLDLCKDILIKDFDHFHDRPLYYNEKDDPLSAHLLHITGEKWRRIRKMLSPTFTSGKMKFMFPTMVEVSNRFVQVLGGMCEQSPVVEIKELLSRFTTDVIGSCAFGIECDSMENHYAEFRVRSGKVFTDPRHSSFTIFLCGQFPKLARALGIKVFRDDVADFFKRAIKEVITHREVNAIQRNDFVNLLMQLKSDNDDLENEGKLTTNELFAQAVLFFVAGFESSASTLSFALFELAKNSEIQSKARAEINEVLTKYQGEFSYEAIMNMQYIDQIVSETLRKYAPIPRLVRHCTKPYKIPSTGLVIEKGTIVFIPTYSIQNDPAFYKNPEIFDPSRFDPEEVQKRHPMAFLGFGDGPRHCIGLRFARMEVTLLIAKFLKHFEINTCHQTPKRLRFNLNTEILSAFSEMYFEIRKINA